MNVSVWLLVLVLPALLLLPQLFSALGLRRGALAAVAALALLGGGWWLLDRPRHAESADAPEPARIASASPETCIKCHEDHYASWRRTYHRTMTREATPEYVKGDFRGVTFHYRGTETRLTREGDTFWMETVDPGWAQQAAKSGKPPEEWGPAPRQKLRVDRLVGSHWFQECLHQDKEGRYWRLPVSYHIVEGRWVHTNAAFLAPDTDDFWAKSSLWNETCVFCHNTRVVKRPRSRPPWQPGPPGYHTEVSELGISCEACHGPGERHVRLNQNPARRFALRAAGEGDPSIINPRRLSVERADAVCAHCHGAIVPRAEKWDLTTVADPFFAGQDLRHAYFFFWSEAEQKLLTAGADPATSRRKPGPDDGRFWGDGTPLTTALEYTGMALSACYEGGHGQLSCLSCHEGHPKEPNFLLRPRMDTNEACYQCHDSYRGRLEQHTHHSADSPGSLCYNCHMPYQVYSLLTTHRSHRIVSPRVKDSLGTGKPHACNLCHLDKSLGWTQDLLGKWYGTAPEPLPEEQMKHASALLHLCRSDARSRVIVAGAFSWPPARAASGESWMAPVLLTVLDRERYAAVRYLGHRALRSLHGQEAAAYDYQAGPALRHEQLLRLRARLPQQARPADCNHPHLPLDREGRLQSAVLEQLFRKRHDPDIFIHE